MRSRDRVVDDLRRSLDATAVAWTVERAGLLRLGLVTALAAALALIAFVAGGYHAGFAPMHGLARDLPPWLLQGLTHLGDSLIVLVGLLVFGARHRAALWTGVLASLIGTLLSRVPKALLDASRPPAVLEAAQLHVVGPAYRSGSFPSGHTVSIFIAAGMLLYFARNAGWRGLGLLLAAAVGASRVWVGVHWPVDVLTGATIGLAAVLLAVPLAQRWQAAIDWRGHAALLAILGGCAVALLFIKPDYPMVRPLARAVGVAGLAALAWHARHALRVGPGPTAAATEP